MATAIAVRDTRRGGGRIPTPLMGFTDITRARLPRCMVIARVVVSTSPGRRSRWRRARRLSATSSSEGWWWRSPRLRRTEALRRIGARSPAGLRTPRVRRSVVPNRRVVFVAAVSASVAVSGAIVAAAAMVSALKTGPPATYPEFTHAGRVALAKRAHAEAVKCPQDNKHSFLVLGGPGNPIPIRHHTTSAHASNRWAVLTLTYITRADGPHPHYSLKLKTVHGKTAKLCNDFMRWGTDIYPKTYYTTDRRTRERRMDVPGAGARRIRRAAHYEVAAPRRGGPRQRVSHEAASCLELLAGRSNQVEESMRRVAVLFGIAASCVTAVAAGTGNAGSARNGMIAFMRAGTVGAHDIWVVRPDGSGLRRLTRSPQGRDDYNPAWSPDGSTVLFERRKVDSSAPGGDEAIYAVGADASDFHQVTHCPGDCWSDSEPAWAPDASRIAFGRATGPRSAPGPSRVSIAVAQADGSDVRLISRPPRGYEDHDPTWSRDGHTIVFQRNVSDVRSTTQRSRLVAVDVATRAQRDVYVFPTWAQGQGTPSSHRTAAGSCSATGACRQPVPRTPGPQREARHDPSRWARPARAAAIGRRLRRVVTRQPRDRVALPRENGPRPHPNASGGSPYRLCISKLDGTRIKRFPWPLTSVHPDWAPTR